jgi:hypothetical protein
MITSALAKLCIHYWQFSTRDLQKFLAPTSDCFTEERVFIWLAGSPYQELGKIYWSDVFIDVNM